MATRPTPVPKLLRLRPQGQLRRCHPWASLILQVLAKKTRSEEEVLGHNLRCKLAHIPLHSRLWVVAKVGECPPCRLVTQTRYVTVLFEAFIALIILTFSGPNSTMPDPSNQKHNSFLQLLSLSYQSRCLRYHPSLRPRKSLDFLIVQRKQSATKLAMLSS